MRIWVDATGSSRLLFFAPIVRRLEDQGHAVTLTTRRIAPAALLLKRYGLRAVIGAYPAGGPPATRAIGLAGRTLRLIASARTGHYDVVVGSAATDLALAARALGVPQLAVLDHDRLRPSHSLNVRLADEIAVPDSAPLERLLALGAQPEKVFRFAGYREEYYLYDFEPDPAALAALGVDQRRVIGIVRPPSGRAFGERGGAASLALGRLLADLCARPHLTLIVIARSDEQRRHVLALGLKNLVVAPEPVDSLSLIAAADFVIANAGVMCREAAALGTPAYVLPPMPTVRPAPGEQTGSAAASGGALARVPPPPSAAAAARRLLPPASDETAPQPMTDLDRRLLLAGRLTMARSAADVSVRKKDSRAPRGAPRDPQIFVDEILALARRGSRGARRRRV